MMMKVTATTATSSVAAAGRNSWPQKFLHFTNRDNNLLLLSLLSLRAYWYPSMRKWRIMIYLLLSVVCVLCCVWACSSTRCNHNLCRDACERFIFIYVMWILFFFVPFYDIIFCCVWDIKKSLYFFFLVCTRWRAHRAYLHLSYIYIFPMPLNCRMNHFWVLIGCCMNGMRSSLSIATMFHGTCALLLNQCTNGTSPLASRNQERLWENNEKSVVFFLYHRSIEIEREFPLAACDDGQQLLWVYDVRWLCGDVCCVCSLTGKH